MKIFRIVFAVVAAVAVFLTAAGTSLATPEITKKEKKPCGTCHVKPLPKKGDSALNNVGNYYKEKKSLEGAPAPKK